MSNILPIITNPNKILRNISKEIDLSEIKSNNFSILMKNMEETMIKKDGIGLAAPQIGKNIRLIVVKINDTSICMINPKITKKSWATEIEEEGCLSIPNTYGKVKRHKQINCIYIDKNNKKQKIKLKKLNARVVQHEIDHLNGILFIDKAKKIKHISPGN